MSLTSLLFMSILLQRMTTGIPFEYWFICLIQSSIELNDDLSVTEKTSRMPIADL